MIVRGQAAFLASVLLHAALAVLLLSLPVHRRAAQGRAWIEARPPPPAPPAPSPEPQADPAETPQPEAAPRTTGRRPKAQPEGTRRASAAGAPESGSASPLSGLDSTGPGLAFEVPAERGPKGMAFPPPGEKPGTATVGPARSPPPIRLDDGTRSPEEVRRIARQVKQGFEAQPHSNVVQKYGGPVARQSTYFPGYGNIPSDKVCRTRDGNALRATIPAFELTVCDRWDVVDHGDVDDATRAPRLVCVESHVEHVEERTLEAPRHYLSHECMEVDRDPWHMVIDWETKTAQARCLRWEDIDRENELTYRAKRFVESYEEDRGILVKLDIPLCDEPGGDEEAGKGDPARLGGGAQPLRRGAAAQSREAASTAQGPAQQGWGPDGYAGGAGRHAPLD